MLVEQIDNLKSKLISAIEKIEFFEFDIEGYIVTIADPDPFQVVIQGIEQGTFVGYELWDGQTGDACKISPNEIDIRTLSFLANEAGIYTTLSYVPDFSNNQDILISKVIKKIETEILSGEVNTLLNVLRNFDAEQLQQFQNL